MYQQIILVGNIGSEIEMRYTPSGVPVAKFSLAVNKSWTDGNGNKQQKVTWFKIDAWRKQAEIASQYLTKGQQIMVIGEIEEARAYTNRAGELAASLEVTAQVIKFLGSKGDNAAHTSGATAMAEGAGGLVDESEIPF